MQNAGFKQGQKDFRRARSGSTTTMFAMAMPVLFGLSGGAIDYASLTRQNNAVRLIAESAALAVAREMTLSTLNSTQVQSVALNFANANGQSMGVGNLRVTASLSQDGMAVKVAISAPAQSALGLLPRLANISDIQSDATARVGQQSKLCLLSLSEVKSNSGTLVLTEKTGIDLQKGSRITANGCIMHTNIRTTEAVRIASGAEVKADLVCAVGGVKNDGGMVQGEVINNCPKVANPMENRIYPAQGTLCNHWTAITISSGARTLNPGMYCGSVTISGDAQVKLNPGMYVFMEPLIVKGNAALQGDRVGMYFRGYNSYFRFTENALINISAPETGEMAGILIWEGANGVVADQRNKGANYHQIATSRAQRLTGTIYLPGGRLLVDAPHPVAAQSEFTVLVVNRLDLSDGPNLVLNSNYASTRVPVPSGLGPIGAKNVRLEK